MLADEFYVCSYCFFFSWFRGDNVDGDDVTASIQCEQHFAKTFHIFKLDNKFIELQFSLELYVPASDLTSKLTYVCVYDCKKHEESSLVTYTFLLTCFYQSVFLFSHPFVRLRTFFLSCVSSHLIFCIHLLLYCSSPQIKLTHTTRYGVCFGHFYGINSCV